MKSQKIGGARQLRIESITDLKNSVQLHPTLWAATSVPKSLIHLPEQFLNFLSDQPKILYTNLQEAITWMLSIYQEEKLTLTDSFIFSLEQFTSTHPDYHYIEHAFTLLDSPQEKWDTLLERINLTRLTFNRTLLELSPLLPEEYIEAPHFKELFLAIFNFSHPDNPSRIIAKEDFSLFLETLHAYLEYKNHYHHALAAHNTTLLPLLENTVLLSSLYLELKPKLIEYFHLCTTKKFFDQALYPLNQFDDFQSTKPDFLNSHSLQEFLLTLPIAAPHQKASLSLKSDSINPLYEEKINTFFTLMKQLFPSLNEITWNHCQELETLLAPYHIYCDGNPSLYFNRFTLETLQQFSCKESVNSFFQLFAESEAISYSNNALTVLEKAIYFQHFILSISNNFISFHDLYSDQRALFEQGDLYIDGKYYRFSLLVNTIVEHKLHAKNSNIFLLYLQINAPTPYTIAVPVTAGLRDNLALGKRGVFKEYSGSVYDAIIVDMIENPISIKESLFYPITLIKSAIAKRFQTMSAQNNTVMNQAATQIVSSPSKTASLSPGLPMTLMGSGVAIAAIGSSFTYIVSKLMSISLLKIFFFMILLFALLSIPSLLVTQYKLKRRDISAILEGSHFAINAQMKLNRHLSLLFTQKYSFPITSIFHSPPFLSSSLKNEKYNKKIPS